MGDASGGLAVGRRRSNRPGAGWSSCRGCSRVAVAVTAMWWGPALGHNSPGSILAAPARQVTIGVQDLMSKVYLLQSSNVSYCIHTSTSCGLGPLHDLCQHSQTQGDVLVSSVLHFLGRSRAHELYATCPIFCWPNLRCPEIISGSSAPPTGDECRIRPVRTLMACAHRTGQARLH